MAETSIVARTSVHPSDPHGRSQRDQLGFKLIQHGPRLCVIRLVAQVEQKRDEAREVGQRLGFLGPRGPGGVRAHSFGGQIFECLSDGAQALGRSSRHTAAFRAGIIVSKSDGASTYDLTGGSLIVDGEALDFASFDVFFASGASRSGEGGRG